MTLRKRVTDVDVRFKQAPAGRVALNRALSKLGILSRSEATSAILTGRVRLGGRVEHKPTTLIVPGRTRIELDGQRVSRVPWRTVLLYKPRGVLTTKRDPAGRPTVSDVLGEAGRALNAVGRLDLATSGLLLLTTDNRLADWILDPSTGIARVYLVTVRGRVSTEEVAGMLSGVAEGRRDHLQAAAVRVVKSSGRESHLVVELREGRNREVRRLCERAGHDVIRLKRVQLGGLDLGRLRPGEWREVTRSELRKAFPGAPV